MARLDARDKMPKAMENYLSNYGWHFNKKLSEFAGSMMKKKDGSTLVPHDKEKAETIFKQYGVNIPIERMYDAVYVLNMARADFLGNAITDEQHLAKFVQAYIEDPDGYDEIALSRFYADCIMRGVGIPWDDVL